MVQRRGTGTKRRALRAIGAGALAGALLAAGLLLPQPFAAAATTSDQRNATTAEATIAGETATAATDAGQAGTPTTGIAWRGTAPTTGIAWPGTAPTGRSQAGSAQGGRTPAGITPTGIDPANADPAGIVAGGARGPVTESATAGTGGRQQAAGSLGFAGALGSCPLTLNVVAHQDDDLLFINPAVADDIASGRCVVTVFITAGDAGLRAGYWRGREAGAMAAYAAMAGVPDDWTADGLGVDGHRISRRTLVGGRVALLFLRLPDNHGNAARPGQTLQKLWRGDIGAIEPLDSDDAYTVDDLIGALTALMDGYQPDEINTLDYAGAYGDGDHVDHHTAGYLAYAAQRDYLEPHRISGYMGYPVEWEPRNLADGVRNRKLAIFLAYAPHDSKVCRTAARCLANFYAPRFDHGVVTSSEAVAEPSFAP